VPAAQRAGRANRTRSQWQLRGVALHRRLSAPSCDQSICSGKSRDSRAGEMLPVFFRTRSMRDVPIQGAREPCRVVRVDSRAVPIA
jgi:hypothetical protein